MADSSILMSYSFIAFIANCELSATAARRNKSFVLSELESVIIQDTILSIRAKEDPDLE